MRTWIPVLMLLAVVLAGCSSDSGGDRDRDGLPDSQEAQGWTIIIDLMGRRIARDVTSDPDSQDTDGDGVVDPAEYALGLDPRDKDTDDDGLSDCQEVMHTVLAECEDPNWEGTTDGGYKTIGYRADSDAFQSRYVRDVLGIVDESGTWDGTFLGDGIPDGEEILGYEVTFAGKTRIVTTNPLRVDTDGDQLEDGEERFLYGSDPLNPDTDGDGCSDGLDPIPEAAETLSLGLESITWAPPGRSGSAEIRLLLHLADNGFNHPVGGTFSVQHGVSHDLTGADIDPVRQKFCTFPPWHPWVRISIQAVEITSEGGWRGLNVSGADVPNDLGMVWWNVRTHEFHFDAESFTRYDAAQTFVPANGRFAWHGADGNVVFSPVVLGV